MGERPTKRLCANTEAANHRDPPKPTADRSAGLLASPPNTDGAIEALAEEFWQRDADAAIYNTGVTWATAGGDHAEYRQEARDFLVRFGLLASPEGQDGTR